MTRPLSSLVIVGGGSAGWIAAAMLARFVPRETRLTLVESDAIGTVGVGEATIPQILHLVHALGLDEDKLLAATGGTFKLGIEFAGWGAPDGRYIHAFGPVGRGWGVTPFHHLWLRARETGAALPLDHYTLSAMAAAAGRFGRPGPSYAYHFDASLFAQLLRRVAEDAGVVRVEGRIDGVERDGEQGRVTALRLDDGRDVTGDLFLDCSGFASILLGKALGTGFEAWDRWLPCDRALAVPSPRLDPLPPYTRATAKAAGWQWRIPLQHRTGNGLVYASAHLSDDEAAATLLAGIAGAPLADPKPIRFTAGKRRAFWVHNVVAVGLASGFLEPLESTSIHMVQSAVARLMQLFPDADVDPTLARAYNRLTHAEMDHVRDFLALHYHANGRDEPMWRQCRDTPPPDGTAEMIARFRAGAVILPPTDALFTEPGWLQVMIGQGIMPRARSPLADRLPAAELDRLLATVAAQVDADVARLPGHDAFVRSHCAMRS